MKHAIGSAVSWTSSNTEKTGNVICVVPAGSHPRDLGHPTVGKGSLPRGEESYVVKGGQKGGASTLFWPLVSLLRPANGLTPSEIAWCNAHADAVRELIATSTGKA